MGQPVAQLIDEGTAHAISLKSTDFIFCAGVVISCGQTYGLIHGMGPQNAVELMRAIIDKLESKDIPLTDMRLTIRTVASPNDNSPDLYETNMRDFLSGRQLNASIQHICSRQLGERRIPEISVCRP